MPCNRCKAFALPSLNPDARHLGNKHPEDETRLEPNEGDSRAEIPGLKTATLAARLTREITGDVFFDPFNRGRYATDASFYQMMPAGVVVPRTMDDALRALAICRDAGRIVTPRGGGTSQCGQTVNDGVVIDFSKHLNRIISLDVENRTCVVEPGIVLDDLNRQLKKHGLWFPVDVSTASRATIGGMAGNNSCGGRSLATAPCATIRAPWTRHLPTARCCILARWRGICRQRSRAAAGLRCFVTCSISASAKPPRSPRNSRRCSAASAATISMRWFRAMRRTTWRICWWARKARWPSRPRSS